MPGPAHSSTRSRKVVGRLETFGGSAFVQERLALLGKVVFLLSFGFFLVMNGIFVIALGVPIGGLAFQQSNVFHFLASSVMAALWAAARARPWSPAALEVMDAGSVILGGIGLACMAAHPAGDTMTALFAISVTVLARAILVPSTARRTFVVSGLATAPVLALVAFGEQPHPPSLQFPFAFVELLLTVSTSLWIILVVTLSTVASHTIFSLRQQVREAREIGQYTLEEKIGGGGMGEVWRARHRMLIRPAAVKLIRPAALGVRPRSRRAAADAALRARGACHGRTQLAPHGAALRLRCDRRRNALLRDWSCSTVWISMS